MWFGSFGIWPGSFGMLLGSFGTWLGSFGVWLGSFGTRLDRQHVIVQDLLGSGRDRLGLVGLITCVSAGAGIGPGSTLASGPKLLPQHRRQAPEAMIQYASEPRGVSGGGAGGGSLGCTSSLCTVAPLSVLRDVIG